MRMNRDIDLTSCPYMPGRPPKHFGKDGAEATVTVERMLITVATRMHGVEIDVWPVLLVFHKERQCDDRNYITSAAKSFFSLLISDIVS